MEHSSALVTEEAIQLVISNCGCPRKRAITLLQCTGDDPAEATRLFQMTVKVPQPEKPLSVRPTEPPTPPEDTSPSPTPLAGGLYREVPPRKPVPGHPDESGSDCDPHLAERPSDTSGDGRNGNLHSMPGQYPPDSTHLKSNSTNPEGGTSTNAKMPEGGISSALPNGDFTQTHSDGSDLSNPQPTDRVSSNIQPEEPLDVETPEAIPTEETQASPTVDHSAPEQTLDSDPLVDPPNNVDEQVSPEVPEEDKEPPTPPEWDYALPRLTPPTDLAYDGIETFSFRDLVAAMQNNVGFGKIQSYISSYDDKTFSKAVKKEKVLGFPSIFYAVETNDDLIIRLWVSHGGDIHSVHEASGVPLLAFAVFNSDNIHRHTTLAVATLLSLGASPKVFPKAFYTPFHKDLPEDGPDEEDLTDLTSPKRKWCTSENARKKLARTLNLSQRYYLERATKLKRPSIRQRQVALRRNAVNMLGIEYFLIGQTGAATSLKKKLLSYMTLQHRRPLVLVFTGPSGHGKTELARRLGLLLSLPINVVDCTIYKQDSDLFGHRPPFAGAREGTPTNNFIAAHSGRQCIMFLDEFEKTTSDIHKSLLIPFDNGEYEDRRVMRIVDCSKMIWILATNALDPTIMDFCRKNKTAIYDSDSYEQLMHTMKELSKDLKNEFKQKFKPPLTGRISAFIPFVPFSKPEQSVVAHKYVLELAELVRVAVNLSYGDDERLLGNVYLRVKRDSSVCTVLAEEGYDEDLGARSLINTVKFIIEEVLVEAYLELEEEIKEGQEMMEFVVSVVRGEVSVTPVRKIIKPRESEIDDEEDDDDLSEKAIESEENEDEIDMSS